MGNNITIQKCMDKKKKGKGVILHGGKVEGFVPDDGKSWRDRIYGYVSDLRLYVRPRRHKGRSLRRLPGRSGEEGTVRG